MRNEKQTQYFISFSLRKTKGDVALSVKMKNKETVYIATFPLASHCLTEKEQNIEDKSKRI